MIKVGAMRFVAVVFVVFCINTHVLADVKLQGPVTDKEIEFATNKFKFNLDYTKTYAYYNTTDKNQEQPYTLDIGGCKLEFRAWLCDITQVNKRHQMVGESSSTDETKRWIEFHDDFPFGSVDSSISFHAIDYFIPGHKIDESYSCIPQFDSTSVPGKYRVKVSLTGKVSPDLVVNFIGEDLSTTTKSTTTSTTTTQASTSTTTIPPTTTTLAPTTDPCDEALSEPRYFCNDDGYVDEL